MMSDKDVLTIYEKKCLNELRALGKDARARISDCTDGMIHDLEWSFDRSGVFFVDYCTLIRFNVITKGIYRDLIESYREVMRDEFIWAVINYMYNGDGQRGLEMYMENANLDGTLDNMCTGDIATLAYFIGFSRHSENYRS